MARGSKLKVFRTPIGFHDAYVAVPSQKAALKAWGTSTNLFARGEAEIVTDDALMSEPLGSPGKVVRRLRGTAEQHLASLPRHRPAKDGSKQSGKSGKPSAKQKPRPSRADVDRLEADMAALEKRQRDEVGALEQEAAAIRKRIGALERSQKTDRAKIERKLGQARWKYERALKAW